ncbi:hypothetical protein [Microseira sp. BLCC-F43]|jgi:hypothetical protein|uniref:hypothetical protein n=1 Tax=Microseira sp. BLCC-F43 TaxID=3153602 RepID=UPI0035B8A3BA
MSSFNDVDLSNSDFWEVEHFEIVLAQLHPEHGRLAIPDFDVPVFRRSRIMAARFHNPVAKPWWKLGCYLNQSIAAPAALDPSGAVQVASWRIPLYQHATNKKQLVFFPALTPRTWKLTASVPRWHQQAHITVWRYTGELPPPFWETISVIDSKTNQILERLSSGNP